MANKIIFIAGPTAVGKTEIALRMAKYFKIEIISVDSALIYQDLNIGSAKPSLEELDRVPHHLIDILSPLENYSVMEFIRDTNQAITQIIARGNLPVLVGGTMMYYNALINGISKLPEADYDLRKSLDRDFAQFGNQVMHERLKQLDELSAAKIAINDTQRIQRALEVCILTGKSMSAAQDESWLPGLVNCEYLPLAIVPANRQLLHERINLRFAKMLEHGFIDEVRNLQQKYPTLSAEHNSMRTVGYRQVWNYLAGAADYNTMLNEGQAATRQLAKRQITWLRSMKLCAIDDLELNLDVLEQKAMHEIERFCL